MVDFTAPYFLNWIQDLKQIINNILSNANR